MGVTKGAHSFEWELGQDTFRQIDTGEWDVKSTPIGRSPVAGRIQVADFNGDGRDDILYVKQSDPNQFYILLSDNSFPGGFAPPFATGIPVPRDQKAGRPFIFPDAASDFMNILVLDDTKLPGTVGSPQISGIPRRHRPLGCLRKFGTLSGLPRSPSSPYLWRTRRRRVRHERHRRVG